MYQAWILIVVFKIPSTYNHSSAELTLLIMIIFRYINTIPLEKQNHLSLYSFDLSFSYVNIYLHI